MVRYPIGIQSFEKLRRGGFVYVDKTEYVYDLVNRGAPIFLSRPRRFGKSLLMSTIEAYFLGKKELFEDLAISQLEQDWHKHAVLHLDMNTGDYTKPEGITSFLSSELARWEKIYGREETEQGIGERFKGIIERAYGMSGREVVILIDEYDKPMLQVIDHPDRQDAYRDALRPLYGCLKTMDRYIRFTMLTGVTKFGKLSVFSDLNNLEDISLLWDYNGICGVSEDELEEYFRVGIEKLAQRNRISYDECIVRLAKFYDGYHFSENPIGVYNPFGLLSSLSQSKFGYYWYLTGSPTFLIKLLMRHKYEVKDLEDVRISEKILSSVETLSTSPIPVMYQSGYLTVKDYDALNHEYTLGYPNQEVRECFLDDLLPYFVHTDNSNSSFAISKFVDEVRNGDIDAFLKRLQSLLGSCDYHLITECEKHYQNVLYIVFTLMGFRVQVEQHTSNGRIDMVVQTDRYIYVMEFKYTGTAQEAIDQIKEKGYALPYQSDSRTLFKVGVAFDSATRTLAYPWIVQEIPHTC